MDQLSAMRAFVRVVETGSFTKAAESLRVPKPSLTKLVQQLEGHVGAKLLNRTTRRVGVSTDGAIYYERATRLLGDIDELDGSMTSSQTAPKGRLRVDMSTPIATHLLIPVLCDFHKRYPDIQLEITVTDRAIDLIGENVDCVIRGGELSDQSLIARRIGDLQFTVCAAPSYIEKHGMPTHPSDLDKDHYTVAYLLARTGRPYPWEFVKGDERVEVQGRYFVAVNDSQVYVTAALHGQGVIQAASFMVQEHLKSGALVPVLTDWHVENLPMHIVYPPNRYLSNRLRVFVDWVAETFSKNEWVRRAS
ncbi:LysR family transcriptional regulator [Roseiterribacter gracilis]|uniref:LysR family transcriptional regulator n=1 Tax=Roseiterribacter gracilis TaxID=2812848 RepID=A0A8S8XB13_9PROT|nr:LysR family transcriptional regulator [Rhodospirillales bacterium TMPK1]